MWKKLIAILVLLGSLYLGRYINSTAPILTGYNAKWVCSAIFVSGRGYDDIVADDLIRHIKLTQYVTFNVDMNQKWVEASVFGFFPTRSYYTEHLGCTLHYKSPEIKWIKNAQLPKPQEWVKNINPNIQELLDTYIKNSSNIISTRQVVLVHKGVIVGESCRDGYKTDTKLAGWSMSKSIVNAFVGVLVQKGKLNVHERAPIKEWSDPQDPRHKITLDQLLRMSTGLYFEENYAKYSSATRMLFMENSTASYAVSLPLSSEPGKTWQYSSGTTNIISEIVKNAVGGTLEDYHRFIFEEFFNKIGMNITVEPDPSGTFVMSSFTWASARDFARFGQLYLQNGVWNNEEIFPHDWVHYTTTPSPPSNGAYGAHWWLEKANIPKDCFRATGYQGQVTIVCPNEQIVFVRLGLDNRDAWIDTYLFPKILKELYQ